MGFELADRLVGIYKTHDCTKSVTINLPPCLIISPHSTCAAHITVGNDMYLYLTSRSGTIWHFFWLHHGRCHALYLSLIYGMVALSNLLTELYVLLWLISVMIIRSNPG